MPVVQDPRYTGGIIGGRVPLPEREAQPEPLLGSVLAAGARQSTIAGAAYERLIASPDPDDVLAAPGYDPLDDIAGYEQYASAFIEARTPSEVAGIKARIRSEQADKDVLSRAGLGGPAAEIALNLLDPSLLVAWAVPELAMAKASRVGRVLQAGLEGAAAVTAYESAQQALQETRSVTESALNVTGGVILSGLLGSIGRAVPPAEREAVAQAIEQELRSEVGAASARAPTTLERETFVGGGQAFAEAAGKVPLAKTDLQVVMGAESAEARQVLQELADVPGILGKNVAGDATPVSVESLALMHEGRVAEFADALREQWRAYRDRVPSNERVSRREFESLVAAASRRMDDSAIPEVSTAARSLRQKVFDPLKRDAQELGLLPKDVEALAADSYFMRMYDRDAIRAQRAEWDALLTSHFQAKGAEYAEARTIADDITRRILGMDRGLANFNVRSVVPDAGPLNERVLDIRDELLERFLVSDPLKVAGAYVRELGPQVEMVKRFGDKDMKDAVQRIRDDYAVRRERAGTDSRRVEALQQEEVRVLEALGRVRDRIYGRAGRLGPDASMGQRRMVDVLRGWRNMVAAAKMGGTAVTGGTMDAIRIMAQYGFQPTMGRLVKLATSPAFRSLAKQQARRLGVATEVALAKRVQLASDGAVTEGWTQILAETVYKASGLNHITDFLRTLTGTLIEDRILAAASAAANRNGVDAFTRARLASLGISSSDLPRIHELVKQYGSTVDGVRTSGSFFWPDAELAARYDAAVAKEARIAVMAPGAADRVWWTDSEIGKTLGQLKAFSLSSPLRLTMMPVQMAGMGRWADAARFMGFMMVGGYLNHVFRSTAAGLMFTTDPVEAAQEAIAETGMLGILPDLASPVARRFGLLDESARYSDRNVTSAFGGPAVGAAVDLYDVIYNRSQGGMSAADLRAVRRLLPFQNLWMIRRGINAIEGEIAEAFDLEGATQQTFMERVTETRPLPEAQERGATGTGNFQF